MFDALDGSRSDESQASQLLRAALRHGVFVSEEPKPVILPASKNPNISLVDASPYPSSEERSLPHYQLHGLDVTSPSQPVDRHAGEDSQKENDPALNDEQAGALAQHERRHSPTRSSRAPAVAENHARTKDTPLNPPSTGIKGQKAVSFKSPIPSPHPTLHRNPARSVTLPSRRPPARSPSPASQDSFAGPLSEADQQKLYIRNSRAFQIPLSELGKDTDVSDVTADTTSTTSAASAHSRVGYSLTSDPPSSSGQILVASTPSGSPEVSLASAMETQRTDTSAPYGDTQIVHPFLHDQTRSTNTNPSARRPNPPNAIEHSGLSAQQLSSQDGSTQPSLSYQRVLDTNPFESSPVPTQVDEQNTAPTQPSSYVTPDVSLDPSSNTGTADASVVDQSAATYSVADTSTTSGIKRNLMGLVHPNKRWRLQAHGIAEPSNRTSHFTEEEAMVLADSIVESGDTQPSDVAVYGSTLSTEPQSQRAHPTKSPMPPPQLVPQPRIRSPSVNIVPETSPAGPGEGDTDKDEEDVPLAQTVQRDRGRKEKGKAKVADAPPVTAALATRTRTRAGGKAHEEPVHKISGAGPSRPTSKSDERKQAERSWETGVVPSSLPHEDAPPPPIPAATAGPSAPRPINERPPAPRGKARAKSRSATPALKKPRLPSEVTSPSEGETVVSEREDVAVPNPDDEVDDITEPADDGYMEVDEMDYVPPKASSSRKRKRTASSSSWKPTQRMPSRPTRSTTVTPLNKPTKKRSVSSSVLLEQNPDATRVFALWKQDNHYYTGIVHSLLSDNPPRYLIKFDDDTEDRVDVAKLRMCMLKEGDHVITGTNVRAVVVEDTPLNATDVNIRFSNSDDNEPMTVSLSSVRVASRTLMSRFKDRLLDPPGIIPAIGPAPPKPSPSPSRLSHASGGSANSGRKLLGKTGLVVTLGPGNEDWERVKDKLMLSIRTHGGVVIEDWCNIFTLDGTFSHGNKRWIGQRDDIKWIERDDIERVFLLSDDANQKPKFLIALALGIPCLSTDWLEASIADRTERDWQAFLLPAGFCDPLNARVSQLVDLDWGNSVEHLTEIMSNFVPSRLFADQSILCLSPDFMPCPPKSNRKARESGGMVPKIILCMGAARVEAVADARHATHSDLKKYDYVIVREQSDALKITLGKGATCVHFGWVKDCLIACRLLPRPEY